MARQLGVDPATVSTRRHRVAQRRLDGRHDDPRPGGPRSITERPGRGGDRKDVGGDAKRRHPLDGEVGGPEPVRHQSDLAGLWVRPYLTETFKLSFDPRFREQVRDIVGLRGTRPMPPSCYASTRRPRSFRRFLDLINGTVPEDLDVHLVVGHVCTHQAPEIRRSLLRHPASTCASLPPTARGSTWWSAGWPSSPRSGCEAAPHRSTKELEASTKERIETWNPTPVPSSRRRGRKKSSRLAGSCAVISDSGERGPRHR